MVLSNWPSAIFGQYWHEWKAWNQNNIAPRIRKDLYLSRLFKSLLHLNRTPEILECIRSVENPFELIGRYLKVSSREYPFEFRFRNFKIERDISFGTDVRLVHFVKS